MTVKALKLLSGEELIGEVVHEETVKSGTDDILIGIVLKNIVAIMMQRSPNGDLTIGFVPFAPYCGKDATFEFSVQNCVFIKEVDMQMANQYNSIFGGIVTPPKSLILG
jgi:hypothetical protein